MKAKKFRVTLIVLSFAVFSILKYCSKTCYWLADWELCSHEEQWSPWAQFPMSRSTWDESFKGSNAAAKAPRYSKESKEDVAGNRTGTLWSSSRTWHRKGNVCNPVSKMLCLTMLLPLLVQLVVAAFQVLLVEAQDCCLGCLDSSYASPAYAIHINCSHSSFWRDLRSSSERTMESQLFSTVQW